MSIKGEHLQKRGDRLKWASVVILLLLGIAANYYFVQQPLPLQIVGWIVIVCIALFIAFQTNKGRVAWKFLKECRNEVRKVVWPNRQETFQTTLVVVVVVFIFAIAMWGMDSFLMWAITWLTGARG
ncbi:MAG: preprotein translocase subunit SecE [Pseudomonadota bacterium]|nr:preprotein translocase subunit SecE [Gammaproteobacteria bacterium]MBU1628662.1 preprotein translocase subunit SecE [Gammaproteobacteria bacterium]MBU1926281.1 preprotein translocase subunit SecE [Gammaproteobacteria bacterium]MBU2545917.1 preprotein translocase subunit SecE [Gammaproteobacteria bacterium]